MIACSLLHISYRIIYHNLFIFLGNLLVYMEYLPCIKKVWVNSQYSFLFMSRLTNFSYRPMQIMWQYWKMFTWQESISDDCLETKLTKRGHRYDSNFRNWKGLRHPTVVSEFNLALRGQRWKLNPMGPSTSSRFQYQLNKVQDKKYSNTRHWF